MAKKSIGSNGFVGEHDPMKTAVVLVDEEGYYLGDLKHFDVEGVSDVIMLFSHSLKGFRVYLQAELISLFAKKRGESKRSAAFAASIFRLKISELPHIGEFSLKQRAYVQSFLVDVLGIKEGLDGTYGEFARAMRAQGLLEFEAFERLMHSLAQSPLFDPSGNLVEERSLIFTQLERVVQGLDVAIDSVQRFIEQARSH